MKSRVEKVLSSFQKRGHKYCIFNKNNNRSFPVLEKPEYKEVRDNVVCINIDPQSITEEEKSEVIECLIKSLEEYNDYGF